ncbi:MAG: hypothetical protein MUO82_00395 [Candidatus Thermoplasmatota archaeon]|nr:hypothetical protein [Candidatus Thermoplasmatota archaeon]
MNIAGEKIEKVIISARFYNENGTELFNTDQLNDSITIYNLSEGESKNFTMQVLPWQYSNYIGIVLSEETYKIFYSTESLEFYFT